jgi:hypothetical protein
VKLTKNEESEIKELIEIGNMNADNLCTASLQAQRLAKRMGRDRGLEVMVAAAVSETAYVGSIGAIVNLKSLLKSKKKIRARPRK